MAGVDPEAMAVQGNREQTPPMVEPVEPVDGADPVEMVAQAVVRRLLLLVDLVEVAVQVDTAKKAGTVVKEPSA